MEPKTLKVFHYALKASAEGKKVYRFDEEGTRYDLLVIVMPSGKGKHLPRAPTQSDKKAEWMVAPPLAPLRPRARNEKGEKQ